MTDKQLTQEESLDLIVSMINKSKANFAQGGSFYFLLWGWTILTANLGHFLISTFELYPHPYIVWMLTIPAGIASMIYGIRSSNNAPTKNHLDSAYGMLWLASGLAVVSILFFLPNSREFVNPIILTFAGMATFMSGFLLKFRALIIGGIAIWLCALIAFNLEETMHYLLGAIAILLGYLIPGYLLKRAENG